MKGKTLLNLCWGKKSSSTSVFLFYRTIKRKREEEPSINRTDQHLFFEVLTVKVTHYSGYIFRFISSHLWQIRKNIVDLYHKQHVQDDLLSVKVMGGHYIATTNFWIKFLKRQTLEFGSFVTQFGYYVIEVKVCDSLQHLISIFLFVYIVSDKPRFS